MVPMHDRKEPKSPPGASKPDPPPAPPRKRIEAGLLALDLSMGYRVTLEGGGESVEVMAVPRCDTCRWWGAQQRHGANVCRRTHDSSGLTHGSKAVPVADDGMFAALFTDPDFGCVQWEAKSDEKP